MNQINVSTLKNNLSAILRQVKKGETVIVIDRDQPVAKLSRITAEDTAADGDLLLKELHRKGLARPPKSRKRVATKDLSAQLIHCKKSVVRALTQEREGARF
jgi:prevent-host-death family protein